MKKAISLETRRIRFVFLGMACAVKLAVGLWCRVVKGWRVPALDRPTVFCDALAFPTGFSFNRFETGRMNALMNANKSDKAIQSYMLHALLPIVCLGSDDGKVHKVVDRWNS